MHPGTTPESGFRVFDDPVGSARPPWLQLRTVIQEQLAVEYQSLKESLKIIPIASKHQRQKLYQDVQTQQYWLGVVVSKSHRFDRTEVLKPLPSDTAESLMQRQFGEIS